METSKEKYYTPEIEEFHVGFEYESLQDPRIPNKDSSWDKLSIDSDFDLKEFAYYYYHNNTIELRVKYIDKEDIESLGWKFEGGKLRADFLDSFSLDLHTLDYKYDSQNLTIEYHPPIFYECAIYKFQGTIKNKSELKRLMKQLNIVE